MVRKKRAGGGGKYTGINGYYFWNPAFFILYLFHRQCTGGEGAIKEEKVKGR